VSNYLTIEKDNILLQMDIQPPDMGWLSVIKKDKSSMGYEIDTFQP